MPNRHLCPALGAAACLALLPVAAHAQTAPTVEVAAAPAATPTPAPAPAPAPSATAAFDQVWGAARLYRNDESDGLNELRVIGRLHLDNYVVDAEQGDDSNLLIRRARLGARARLLHNLDVQVETELNFSGGPLYERLTDSYIAWKFSDAARLTVGKHSAKFTLDGSISSNELPTIERSNVANNFWFTEEYMTGASVSGRSGPWSYTGGVFSSGRRDSDFGHFDGGTFILASLGRDFGRELGLKRAVLRLDYVHNKADINNTATRPFSDVAAVVAMLEEEDWGLSGELVQADGYLGQSNAWGSTVISWADVSDRVQAVTRFTYLDSARNNGVRLGRYDNAVTGGRGDRYAEVYAGLNYYIYGNRLKLQTGLAYGHMRDRANDGGAYDGVTWTSALRFNF